ncbi:Regulatory protein, luxR family [Actinacidiphila cocklensis]|uniref:Regulatory protein, luxR family n=1 Tax=Actinacidiphila cocklensis TaxID=887465 RepID=A0A9W4GR18_9ACTN|nr:Regulatory protein, luxR family [Actinacidiphila cocklensis]
MVTGRVRSLRALDPQELPMDTSADDPWTGAGPESPAGTGRDLGAESGRDPGAGTGPGPWAGAGLDPLAGRILDHLVHHPVSGTAAVAAAVAAPAAAVGRALRSLEAERLVIRAPGRPTRWSVGPPRVSLGSLLARRRQELALAEEHMEQLDEVYRALAHPRATPRPVEVLEDEGEVAACYLHLLTTSRHEVLHLAKPPYVTATPDGPGPRQRPASVTARDGVQLRSVYDSEGLTDPVSLETAVRGTSLLRGDLRISSGLPVKLALFDRTAALLPLRGDRPGLGSLLVHSPALLDVLAAFFESIWERAVPMSLETLRDWRVPYQAPLGGEPDARTREILHLMATGLKDEAIARVLGVSRRTVQKHVSEAVQTLGARTRFQVALLAAERGWLTGFAASRGGPPVGGGDGGDGGDHDR